MNEDYSSKRPLVVLLALSGRIMDKELTARQLKQLEKQERRKKYADLAIQGTNNSSIASKRSVELLYLPNLSENTDGSNVPREYFKYFVKKSPKRSPCINRGYWLRLHAIRSRLNSIIEGSDNDIVVVNLGCGFDPLPFELLDEKNPASEKFRGRVRFLDVDYSDLMSEKVKIILQNPELTETVGSRVDYRDASVVFGTDRYVAASCNLNYPQSFWSVLDILNLSDPGITKVFVAEVSLAYMPPEHADKIIALCGEAPNSHFLMLEQLTPAGPSEPFSKQMLKHFKKNDSPLLSVQKYFTAEEQKNRFMRLGFPHVNAGDMFKLWQSVDARERSRVEEVELFDELEEFHLFCHHYIICHATNDNRFQFCENYNFGPNVVVEGINIKQDVQFEMLEYSIDRKFGSCATAKRDKGKSALYFGGSNPGRLNELINIDLDTGGFVVVSKDAAPPPRMCHSLTALDDGTFVMIGGRQRPHQGYADSWILSSSSQCWRQGPNLPETRYRHCATQANGDILVYGGVTTGAPFLSYNHTENAFESCLVEGIEMGAPLISAAMAFSQDAELGVILGGSADGLNVSDALYIFNYHNKKIYVQSAIRHPLLQRYGAKVSFISAHEVLVVGGTSPEQLFNDETSIIIVNLHTRKITGVRIPKQVWQDQPIFLVGFDLASVNSTEHIIVGGGATCYGFGAVNNRGFKIKLSQDISGDGSG